jgi:hypothetical protein
MVSNMELTELIDRVQELRAKGPARFGRERIAEAADAINRAGDMQLRVELANEALAALCVVLYQADADGRTPNLDRLTWRLLVPAPWGRGGWKRWGLRAWEADCLRGILMIRCEMIRHQNLFDYNAAGQTWHIDLKTFPTLETAMQYLKRYPITLDEWRKRSEPAKVAARARMQRRRGA